MDTANQNRLNGLCIARPALIALAVASFALSGCQTGSRVDDRPLLPLFGEIEVNEPVRLAMPGAPTTVESTPEIIPASGSYQQMDKVADTGKGTKDLPPIITRQPDLVLRACYAEEQVVDLASAFRLASLANPTIGLAEDTVRANLAEQMLARALLFPTLNVGTTLSIHRGALLSGRGTVRDVDRESLYIGAGSDVRGAGTLAVPGVHVVSHLGDAAFAPRVAQQKVQGSQFNAAATQNVVLLDVANGYLALVGAEARLLALGQSEKEIAEVAKLTSDFASKGLGREADALRAQSELSLLQSTIDRTEEEVVALASELARLLSTDATVRLRPEAGSPPLIQLVDDRLGLELLLQTAVANHPEIAARESNVALSETRLRQERVRPFLPIVSIGFSAGDFGGGSNLAGYRFSHFNSRTDLDVLAVWTLPNFGMSNRAVQNKVRSEIATAEAHRTEAIDQVQREVTEAFSRARAARNELNIAKRRVQTSQQAFKQDLARTKDRLGNLIEVLSSFNQLNAARQDLIQAMVVYSQAQFQLYVALGSTPLAAPKK